MRCSVCVRAIIYIGMRCIKGIMALVIGSGVVWDFINVAVGVVWVWKVFLRWIRTWEVNIAPWFHDRIGRVGDRLSIVWLSRIGRVGG